LKERATDLSKLSNESYLLPKFVATVMPAYAEVFDDLDSISQLRDYIYGKMGNKKPGEWSDSISAIQKFAKEWLQRGYRQTVANFCIAEIESDHSPGFLFPIFPYM